VARAALAWVTFRGAQDVDGDLIGLDGAADFNPAAVGEELFAPRMPVDGAPAEKVAPGGKAIDNGLDRVSQGSP
jgi:hypothetical protein